MEKIFSSSKQSLVIRPKSINQAAFHYEGFANVKNLILFVGSKPTIDEEGNIYFRKMKILDDSIVLRDAQGKVTEVLTVDEAVAKYEIVAESDFKPEHANKVTPKVVAEKGEKSSNGDITRVQIVEELKSKKMDFNPRASKDELAAVLAKAK